MLVQVPADKILTQQRLFFASGKTKEVAFRIEQLKRLKQLIKEHQEAICQALYADLYKPKFEAYGGEVALCLKEIDYTIKNIDTWTKPKKVPASLMQLPASAKIYPEPLGVVLIIGAWNYPFQLIVAPLIAAIAAGNCAIIKPSEVAANTSHLIADIFQQNFEPGFITVVEGGKETTQELLSEKFDHIFFTGGSQVGKIVMAAAANHLTPVTLELGGKSPCIVDANTNLEDTANKIAWGKFVNAGQTCIAPDYLLVDRQVKTELLEQIKTCIGKFYGDNPATSPDYARIINERHFNRLCNFLKAGEIIIGGETNLSDRYIAPTAIDRVDWDDAIMQEEIFGPILPVLEYTDLDEAIAQINTRPKPLALYFFSQDREKQAKVLRETSSGGVCINDTVIHCVSTTLPFGGVGASGMGSYHGKAGFNTFSHDKSVLRKSSLPDLRLRFPPYEGKLKLLDWLFR